MKTHDGPRREAAQFDADGGAERPWREIRDAVERGVPTFAVGPCPPYEDVGASEARIREELRRALAAGAGSRTA